MKHLQRKVVIAWKTSWTSRTRHQFQKIVRVVLKLENRINQILSNNEKILYRQDLNSNGHAQYSDLGHVSVISAPLY